MKAIVVFESMYGNTRHIAEAIADGLRWSISTDVVLARDAGDVHLDDVELVVVGGPTHAWGLSSKRTRVAAQQDAVKHPDHLLDTAQEGPGIREWLQEVHCNHQCRAVSFDTRLDKPKVFTGSAARSIQRRLHREGGLEGEVVFPAHRLHRLVEPVGPVRLGLEQRVEDPHRQPGVEDDSQRLAYERMLDLVDRRGALER